MGRDPAVTSRIMASVRSQGSKAERVLGSALWRQGLRYRRKSKLFGKPDFVFAGPKVVVFVDGDFWHGRFLEQRIERGDFRRNAEYWIPKLLRNRSRDAEVTKKLAAEGWIVLRFWESEVLVNLEGVIQRISEEIRPRKRQKAKEVGSTKA